MTWKMSTNEKRPPTAAGLAAMTDEPQNLVRSDKINGRGIRGTCNYGQWRWHVETNGPFVQGVHMQIWRLAGDTLVR
jgi:hypothetical protein